MLHVDPKHIHLWLGRPRESYEHVVGCRHQSRKSLSCSTNGCRLLGGLFKEMTSDTDHFEELYSSAENITDSFLAWGDGRHRCWASAPSLAFICSKSVFWKLLFPFDPWAIYSSMWIFIQANSLPFFYIWHANENNWLLVIRICFMLWLFIFVCSHDRDSSPD